MSTSTPLVNAIAQDATSKARDKMLIANESKMEIKRSLQF